MKTNLYLGLTGLLLALAITAGCGKKQVEAKTATQVAAKVNADEITVHQVNNVLARSQNVTPDVAAQGKRAVLDKLIDQQLAKQRAIEKKLDRSPAVMQAIDAARSEILARVYLEQIAATQRRPTAQEVKQYYAEHPELFSGRRIYDLQEFVLLPQQGLENGLREQAARVQSMLEIAKWLESRGVKFAANRGVRAAEGIPLQWLPKLRAMKDGEIGVLETAGSLHVIRVVATKAAPMDEATATPRIQQFLFNQRSSEAIAREMKKLKETASIIYVGEFAGEAIATEAKPAAKAESPPTPLVTPDSDKGVRGLR